MSTKQKISQIVVDNTLAFIQPFASKTLFKAISILLKPCCNFTGEADVSCNDNNTTYGVTITVDPGIGYLGKGIATLQVGSSIFTGVVTEPNTIFVETLTTTAGTKEVNVTLILPTNVAGTTAVTQIFTVEDVVFPSCV
jgi:hypothetical protein